MAAYHACRAVRPVMAGMHIMFIYSLSFTLRVLIADDVQDSCPYRAFTSDHNMPHPRALKARNIPPPSPSISCHRCLLPLSLFHSYVSHHGGFWRKRDNNALVRRLGDLPSSLHLLCAVYRRTSRKEGRKEGILAHVVLTRLCRNNQGGKGRHRARCY